MKKHEIWKPIKGFEGYYEVSNMGNVKRLSRLVDGKNGPRLLKDCLIKTQVSKKKRGGYIHVSVKLNKEGKSSGVTLSKVVYSTFNNLDLNNSLVVVNKDGNKLNNKLENLKIITRRNVWQNRDRKSGVIGVGEQGGLYRAIITFCGKNLLLHTSESKDECYKIHQLAKAMIDEYDKLKAGILSNSRLNNKLIVKSLPVPETK